MPVIFISFMQNSSGLLYEKVVVCAKGDNTKENNKVEIEMKRLIMSYFLEVCNFQRTTQLTINYTNN